MKNLYVIIAALLCFSIACNNAPERPAPATADKNIINATTTAGNDLGVPPPPVTEPPQNALGVWHYTCPSGCAGGAGKADPCATCGTTLVHNTAYHDSNKTQEAGTSIDNPIMLTDNKTIVEPPAATNPEPAQNAAGVWHYTCAKGCAGGAGSAVACATCGETLVHNSGYH